MEAYQVLPLKYRPQTLDEIWVQEHIKITVKRAIETGRVAHAYLFAGPRGVGKTTTARILAKSLNCVKGPSIVPCQVCSVCKEITNSSSLDVLEIDGASNRGIDQVRELRENVKFLPTSCSYKIYIIDEVHMLTQEAFNALLKTLEEPPQHVKFIFATTAPQKVPATILSRCQRFDFRKATIEELVKRLQWICDKEKIVISEEALYAIGKRADGSIRDAESILDQLRTYKSDKITLTDVEDLLGMISTQLFFEYTEYLLVGDVCAIYKFIDKVFATGYDFMEFFARLLEHFRGLLMAKLNVDKTIIGLSQSDIKKYKTQSEKMTIEKILIIMQIIADNEEMIKRTSEPKILFEILTLNLLNTLSNNTKVATNILDITIVWQNILKDYEEKRPSISNQLETAIISQQDDNILLTFQQKSAKTFIETEKEELEKKFSKLLGRQINVIFKFIENSELVVPADNALTENCTNSENVSEKKSLKKSVNPDQIFKEIFPNSKRIK